MANSTVSSIGGRFTLFHMVGQDGPAGYLEIEYEWTLDGIEVIDVQSIDDDPAWATEQAEVVNDFRTRLEGRGANYDWLLWDKIKCIANTDADRYMAAQMRGG